MPKTALTARSRTLIPEAIFGGFDGLTSVFGVLAGLLRQPSHAIVLATLGLAVASGLGMAGGQYQSDDDRSVLAAAVMGGATLAGTLLPTIGFWFLPRSGAVAWMAVSCLLVTALIAHQRKAWAVSFAWFGVVAGVTLAVSLVLPGGA